MVYSVEYALVLIYAGIALFVIVSGIIIVGIGWAHGAHFLRKKNNK